MDKYVLCEQFVSIQGEGRQAGRKAFFIRMWGCNKTCSFCDSPKHTKQSFRYEKTVEELVADFIAAETSLVVITGGEPTLQKLNPLIEALQAEGAFVQIETNGFKLLNASAADFITLSPKDDALIADHSIREVKLPYPCSKKLIEFYCQHFPEVYITPINGATELDKDNVAAAVVEVLRGHGQLRLNTQLHKVWGVE